LKRRSRRNRATSNARLLALFALAAGAGTAYAQNGTTAAPTLRIGASPALPAQRLNPTNHAVTLTIPMMVDANYLGDISLTIEPSDRLEFSSQRVLSLLSGLLTQTALDNLRTRFGGRPVVTPADFEGSGVSVAYNPQTLQLVFSVPPELRAPRGVSVANINNPLLGKFVQPANFAAYVNARGSLDYVWRGPNEGLQSPILYLDGAAWTHGVGLESEGIWQPGRSSSGNAAFQRQGTRVVYDDLASLARFTFGELQPVGAGFQAVPQMAGMSMFRSYSVLEPLQSVRPSGDQTFQLTRASDVRITVNGTDVRYVHLAPGTYNLRDFPFSQGANDISVFIQDDTGRQETLHYNVFFDQTQLAPGLSEFGVFAGVEAPLVAYGPKYLNDWEITGFYRRGISQAVTLGINFQADPHSAMGGYQMLWGTNIGTFGLDLAGSGIRNYGTGYAGTLTYQRLFQFVGGRGDSLNLAVTTRSKNFGAVGTTTPSNIYSYELSGGYTHAFNEDLYGSLTAHFSHARAGFSDVHDYHAIAGYRLTDRMGLTVDTSYQNGGFNHGWGVLLSLTWRVSETGSARGDFNSRRNDVRASYQEIHGTGVDSYNLSADVERADDGSAINATANYIGNRAEVGLSQFSSMDGGFGGSTNERTSARIGTSFAFADGAFSMGRPITQAFAIIEPHKNLGNATVYVEPMPDYYEASSSVLGTALETGLTAYVPRTVTVNVPDAPTGYDLGAGAYRLDPPYRGGYKLIVGSDYSVTALGRLLGPDGKPLALIAGKAVEVADPNREPVQIFTNGAGKFGIAGLRPGKWRIIMPTEPETDYILVIPDNANGVVRAGDLAPSGTGN
jgi:outer membrane usher protein